MDPNLRELLDLALRWVHIIAGIMWVGNSVLFSWLDRNLTPVEDPKEGSQGEIWLLHSGGFYQVEKKMHGPGEMPRMLHWFKWQAGITWISGCFLLGVVYYMSGGAFLVDPSVSAITPHAATLLGIGLLVGAWLVYDLLWKSPLGKTGWFAVLLCYGLVLAVAYGLTHVLSGRAAFLHVGAMLGTIMAGNVWMQIIPSQRQLVGATERGERPDAAVAYRAKVRSLHNNYMTFPLLFLMISNHYPSTYGSRHSWLVLGVLILAGAGVRHWMNIRFTFKQWIPALATTVVVAFAALYVLLVRPVPVESRAAAHAPASFAEARAILDQR